MFNATFSNISAISWRPILVVEEAGVPGENHRIPSQKGEITQIKYWMELSSLVNRLGSTLSTSVLSFKLIALIVIEKFHLLSDFHQALWNLRSCSIKDFIVHWVLPLLCFFGLINFETIQYALCHRKFSYMINQKFMKLCTLQDPNMKMCTLVGYPERSITEVKLNGQ
jgi:hypothetical protein